MTDSTADELRLRWTDDRLADLCDSAQDHLAARRPGQAVAIWKQLISEGGNAADWGHLEYAEYLYDEQQDDEAQAELSELMLGRRVLDIPWRLAAEFLEEVGHLESALFFFSTAVESLTADQRRTTGESAWVGALRAGRRRLRWALEIALDDDDLEAEPGHAETADRQIDLPSLLGAPDVIGGRLHFWARDQLGHAACLWPRHLWIDSADEYYEQIETELRAHRGGRILVVPRSIAAVDDAPDPAIRDARSRAEVLTIVSGVDEGTVIAWPPSRNQECWCGSGAKYKRCCGGPDC